MKFTYYPTYNYVSITSPKAASTLMDKIHNSISKPKSLVDYKIYNEDFEKLGYKQLTV